MITNMLEKEIEKAVSAYAKRKKCLSYKFSSPGRASVPDRIFIGTNGQVYFVEFKRLGLKATEKQQREHDVLRKQNCIVVVIDNVADGMKFIDGIIDSTMVSNCK